MEKAELEEKLQSIYKYCWMNDYDGVKNLLSGGKVDLNDEFYVKNCDYPILIAVLTNNINIVRLLLEYGANPDSENDCSTALSVACEKGFLEVAALLIEHGANVNKRSSNRSSNTPLDMAVLEAQMEVAELLLKKGAHLSPEFDLMDRFLLGNLDMLKLLLNHGVLDMEDQIYTIPRWVSYAIKEDRLDLLNLLINHGVDLNSDIFESTRIDSESRMLPLHNACAKDNGIIVEILLKNGADPNKKSFNGATPFITATKRPFYNDFYAMELLLEYGADINGQDEQGNTALHHCPEFVNSRFSHNRGGFLPMAFLISRGINVEIKNKRNQTAHESFGRPRKGRYYVGSRRNTYTELCKMKNFMLTNYGLNLLEILFTNTHAMTRYLNNVKLKEIFEMKDFDCQFPVTGKCLKYKFSQAEKRKESMDLATESLKNLTNMNIPNELYPMILEHFSNSELKNVFKKADGTKNVSKK